MSKHTAGPWVLDAPWMVATNATGDDGWEICDIRDDVPGCGANARLIAAAPDLLEALEQCITSMLDSGYRADAVVIRAARAAIAKATGDNP